MLDPLLQAPLEVRQSLGLKRVLVINPLIQRPIKAHKTYPYLIRNIDINRANQVWSTNITYLRIKGGMLYLAVIIDWYSKAVILSDLE
jgi:putative transposase